MTPKRNVATAPERTANVYEHDNRFRTAGISIVSAGRSGCCLRRLSSTCPTPRPSTEASTEPTPHFAPQWTVCSSASCSRSTIPPWPPVRPSPLLLPTPRNTRRGPKFPATKIRKTKALSTTPSRATTKCWRICRSWSGVMHG